MPSLTDKFVSVAGSGAHTGVDASNEWTMAEATANSAVGFRMNTLAGTYIADDSASSAVIDLDVAGTIASQIEWRAYTTTIGDFTPGDAQPVIINAGTNALTHGMITTTISGTIFNKFIGFRFTGASSHGVNAGSAGDQLFFEGCKFDNNGGIGLAGDDSIHCFLCELTLNTTRAFDGDNACVLQACIIHGEAVSTAVVTTAGNVVAINNLCYDNDSGAVFSGFANPTYIGNTIDGDNVAGTIAFTITGVNNAYLCISNNIFFDLDTGVNFGNVSVEAIGVRGFNYFSSCNTNYENTPDADTDIDDGTTDPFTNSATRDYTLASGSNAIGAGVDAGSFA